MINFLTSQRADGFMIVHEQTDPERPELTTKFMINPETGQQVILEFVNN